MRIREVTLRELRMKLVAPFETSAERTEERRIILAEVLMDGVIGWGECVAGERPFYSPETTDTAWMIMRDFLWPMINGKEIKAAADAWQLMEPVRGHNMAKAALEAALWDAEAKQKGIPLAKLLGGTRDEISSGVSIGIKDSLDELAAAVRKELAAGYQRIKIKIRPGKELPQVKRQLFPRPDFYFDSLISGRKFLPDRGCQLVQRIFNAYRYAAGDLIPRSAKQL